MAQMRSFDSYRTLDFVDRNQSPEQTRERRMKSLELLSSIEDLSH